MKSGEDHLVYMFLVMFVRGRWLQQTPDGQVVLEECVCQNSPQKLSVKMKSFRFFHME